MSKGQKSWGRPVLFARSTNDKNKGFFSIISQFK